MMMKAEVKAYTEILETIQRMSRLLNDKCDQAVGTALEKNEIPDEDIVLLLRYMIELYEVLENLE